MIVTIQSPIACISSCVFEAHDKINFSSHSVISRISYNQVLHLYHL